MRLAVDQRNAGSTRCRSTSTTGMSPRLLADAVESTEPRRAGCSGPFMTRREALTAGEREKRRLDLKGLLVTRRVGGMRKEMRTRKPLFDGEFDDLFLVWW